MKYDVYEIHDYIAKTAVYCLGSIIMTLCSFGKICAYKYKSVEKFKNIQKKLKVVGPKITKTAETNNN